VDVGMKKQFADQILTGKSKRFKIDGNAHPPNIRFGGFDEEKGRRSGRSD
jgi:hypothetical protein